MVGSLKMNTALEYSIQEWSRREAVDVKRATAYDAEKAWFFINHSTFSLVARMFNGSVSVNER
jgi:hypothetical protein